MKYPLNLFRMFFYEKRQKIINATENIEKEILPTLLVGMQISSSITEKYTFLAT